MQYTKTVVIVGVATDLHEVHHLSSHSKAFHQSKSTALELAYSCAVFDIPAGVLSLLKREQHKRQRQMYILR